MVLILYCGAWGNNIYRLGDATLKRVRSRFAVLIAQFTVRLAGNLIEKQVDQSRKSRTYALRNRISPHYASNCRAGYYLKGSLESRRIMVKNCGSGLRDQPNLDLLSCCLQLPDLQKFVDCSADVEFSVQGCRSNGNELQRHRANDPDPDLFTTKS